uniref:Uncharacterized protein n=1 Tax=Anguilla anguilla TaxID=7936 RepID=A0A0E9R2P8_ANGAN
MTSYTIYRTKPGYIILNGMPYAKAIQYFIP